jgi:hypothetical protein
VAYFFRLQDSGILIVVVLAMVHVQSNVTNQAPNDPLHTVGDVDYRTDYLRGQGNEAVVAQTLGGFVTGNVGVRGLAEGTAIQRFAFENGGVRPTSSGVSFSNVGVKFRQMGEHGWEMSVNPSDTIKLLSVLKPFLLRGSVGEMVEVLKSFIEICSKGPDWDKMFDRSMQIGVTDKGVPYVRFSIGMNIMEALKMFPNLRPVLTVANTVSSVYGGLTLQINPSIFHSSHPGKEAEEFKKVIARSGLGELFKEGNRLQRES